MALSSTCLKYILSVWSLLAVQNVEGVTVAQCGRDQTAEVIQNKTDNTYTCRGIPAGQQVSWLLLTDTSDFGAGSCPGNGGACSQGELGAAFTPTRVNSTAIRLTVDAKRLTNDVVVRSGTLRCSTSNINDSCQTDYIVPAQGTCSTQTGTGSERFKLKGSCSLQAGAMTSRGRYRCDWYQKHKTSSKSLIVNKTLTAANYQKACVMATTVPTVAGQYNYTVILIPGRTVVNAGGINIVRPSPPTISCSPSGFVPVNTAVTCTCTTSSVGQPQGRLKVVKVTDGTSIDTGNYGASSLQMSPQTLTASDHDVNKFRCDVEWVEDVTGQNYKPQVGLPPTEPSLSLNGNQGDQMVNEHQSVTFHCNTTGGRPTPNVTLVNRDNKTELHSGLSPQQHRVTARCEDTGVYVCTADNGMGPVAASNRMLGVQCFPRGENQTLKDVYFTGDPVPVSFDVTAYPLPLKVMFNYEGSPPDNLTGITLKGRCTAKTGADYMSTCTVTVASVTPEAAGVYRVIVSNTVGNGTFNLNVTYGGNMPTAKNTGGDLDPAALGGGIVAAIAVIVIIVIIVILIMKRRKAEKPRNSPNSNNYHDMEESGMADGDQETLSRPLSFAPMAAYAQVDKKRVEKEAVTSPEANGGQPADVYAQVDKPKKSKQGASATEADANGGQPADVYAEVEKTKKKQASGAGAKPKTKAAGKPKKEKKKNDKRDESAHVYGNVEDIKQGKAAKAKKASKPSKEETSSGKMTNPDGLVYTSVEFSQPPKSGKPAAKKPEEEPVVYSEVDFKKSPPAP